MAFGALHDSLFGNAFRYYCTSFFKQKPHKRANRKAFNRGKCRFGHYSSTKRLQKSSEYHSFRAACGSIMLQFCRNFLGKRRCSRNAFKRNRSVIDGNSLLFKLVLPPQNLPLASALNSQIVY